MAVSLCGGFQVGDSNVKQGKYEVRGCQKNPMLLKAQREREIEGGGGEFCVRSV